MQQRVVARLDGLDGEASDAGPGKNGFGDDGAGEQRAELQADDGDDGNERVGKGVMKEYGAFGQAFGAGGAHVIAVQLFEHCAAHHARENGRERRTQRERREHQMRHAAAAGNREPAQLDGEK